MSEESEAKRDGTKLQRNSGRGEYAKGDGLRKYFLVDYKEANKTFTLNKKVWAKVVKDTLKVDADRLSVLKIILGEQGEPKVRLAIVEWGVVEEYEYLRDEVERLQNEMEDIRMEQDA